MPSPRTSFSELVAHTQRAASEVEREGYVRTLREECRRRRLRCAELERENAELRRRLGVA